MQILAPLVFLLGIHALPLPAQDPPLVVKTSSHEVAVGVLVRFGSFDFPPVLGPGEHHVMTLGEGGIKVVKSEGDAPLLQIEARPPALMAMYSDQMAQFRGIARSAGILALGQQGIQPGSAVQIVEAIIGFPNQIEALSLTLTGDPQAPQAGYHAELTLAPSADTWFGSRYTLTARRSWSSLIACSRAQSQRSHKASLPASLSSLRIWNARV